MTRYVVISNHPPNSCPSSHKLLRERGKNLGKDLQPLLQKYHITAETMLHLDPGHKVLWVMQAPNAEAVRDMIYESGLGQWNDFEFYMTTTMEEITSSIEKLPAVW
ncbi:MAG: hypothetical protein QXX17_00195 [Conexivisphaerales archaeon]